jgi:biopolymer transport protein ExbD
MGMSTGGSKGGAAADINVTPLVDICLVLLIIFMVMLPKNVPEISVKVPPDSKTRQKPQQANENLVSA